MDLRIWQTLAEPSNEELVRLAMATDAGDVAAVARLRKLCPDAEVVRAALMLAEARRKAVPKFGAERAATLWADPQGVEMASSLAVAEHKGGRIEAVAGGAPVHDLCCGVGGDTIGMYDAGVSVHAFDADSVRAWMTGMNCGAPVSCARVEELEELADAAHIDPARRSEQGARSWRLQDLRPGPDVIGGLIARYVSVGVKLSPGVDVEDLPAEWRVNGAEVEYISEDGRMTQAVLWTGALARPLAAREACLRSATMFRGGHFVSSIERAESPDPPVRPVARFLAEPDPAVERAKQLAWVCGLTEGGVIHPGLGLITSDRTVDIPALTWFEVLAEMPWNEKRVKAALEERGAGIVEVKTRGKAVDPDAVQLALRGRGEERLTVFVLRFDRALRAIIARRA